MWFYIIVALCQFVTAIIAIDSVIARAHLKEENRYLSEALKWWETHHENETL